MVQRTVLKVDISCEKCKQQLMKAVAGLKGIDKIEVDASKNTLTVTGDADPIDVIVRTRRRTGKHAEVVSIGPLQPPPKASGGDGGLKRAAAEEKPDGGKKAALAHMPSTCHACQQMGLHYQAYMPCSIL